MAIILRLQGLDVKAGAADIRAFFRQLHIPDGGVYIVGGKLREAFIAFSLERDAQLAMRRTGNLLKGSEVTLHISSMAELEHKLKSMLKKKKQKQKQQEQEQKKKRKKKSPQLSVHRPAATTLRAQEDLTANPPSSPAWPRDPDTANLPLLNTQQQQEHAGQALDSGTAFLLGICTVLQGLQSSQPGDPNTPVSPPRAAVSGGPRTPEQPQNSKPGYVRLFGLPASTTKEDICRFFTGLTVQEAIVNVQLGLTHGCLVKFANMQDARDALCFNQQLLGEICVEVRGGTEKMWNSALQECENALKVGEGLKLDVKENHKLKTALQIKRRAISRLPSNPLKKLKLAAASTSPLSPPVENIIMVSKLPKEMNKTEIKELFGCPNISHKKVLHLLDKDGNRTDTAFIFFNRTEDYDYALNLSGCHVGADAIQVSPITKGMMREKMSEARSLNVRPNIHPKTGKENPDQAAQTCLFVRNLPAHVQKSHIGRLFCKYELKQESIVVLHDADGNGLGEAVVQFESERSAALAHRMHGRKYLGAEVLLTRISEKQMEDILTQHA